MAKAGSEGVVSCPGFLSVRPEGVGLGLASFRVRPLLRADDGPRSAAMDGQDRVLGKDGGFQGSPGTGPREGGALGWCAHPSLLLCQGLPAAVCQADRCPLPGSSREAARMAWPGRAVAGVSAHEVQGPGGESWHLSGMACRALAF